MDSSFWAGKRVLVTGHTGFKGSWLTLWLHFLGAKVTGFSLENNEDLSLFNASQIGEDIDSRIGDIRNLQELQDVFEDCEPEIVFHLAAQALVLDGYKAPILTYETNVIGTANVLDCCRLSTSVVAVVNVTSDKCYANTESQDGYVEGDTLGGHDPYSNSKACAELVASCYQNLFLDACSHGRRLNLVSVRAGNVIGGGDWSANRLVPDVIRHLHMGGDLSIRNLGAVRPWQHVIEPVRGYLTLARNLFEGSKLSPAYNFGPDSNGISTVLDLLKIIDSISEQKLKFEEEPAIFHETNFLYLNNSLAKSELGWHPRWSIEQTITHVLSWYEAFYNGENMREFSIQQIQNYEISM